MPRLLWRSQGGGRFLMSEVPLYSACAIKGLAFRVENSGAIYVEERDATTGTSPSRFRGFLVLFLPGVQWDSGCIPPRIT